MIQTYIIKPCKIEETESITRFTKRFQKTGKLYLCTGAAKVGKTALSIKLAHCLYKKNKGLTPVIISLNNDSGYWQNEIQEHAAGIIFYSLFIQKQLHLLKEINTILKDHLVKSKNSFFIIDGINKWDDFEGLIISLIDFIKNSNTNVFLTIRQSELILEERFLKQLQQNNLIELWLLERPEYLGGEIKEFGDTKILILKEFEE